MSRKHHCQACRNIVHGIKTRMAIAHTCGKSPAELDLMIQKAETAVVEMTLTPDMEKEFKGAPFFLEIEMLQGTKEPLGDGRTKYNIEIRDMEKALLVKEFVLKCISMSHKSCQS